MPSSYQIKTSLPHVLKEQKYLLLFQNSSKASPFLLLKKMDLGENYLQNPKSQRMMKYGTRERERERESGENQVA